MFKMLDSNKFGIKYDEYDVDKVSEFRTSFFIQKEQHVDWGEENTLLVTQEDSLALYYTQVTESAYYPIACWLDGKVQEEQFKAVENFHSQLTFVLYVLWLEFTSLKFEPYKPLKLLVELEKCFPSEFKNIINNELFRFVNPPGIRYVWIQAFISLGLDIDNAFPFFSIQEYLITQQRELQLLMLSSDLKAMNAKMEQISKSKFKKVVKTIYSCYKSEFKSGSCLAIATTQNNNTYISVSGAQIKNDNQLAKKLGNLGNVKYVKLSVGKTKYYYGTNTDECIFYDNNLVKKYEKGGENPYNRMFSCTEKKILSCKTGIVKLYIKYSPCEMCLRMMGAIKFEVNKIKYIKKYKNMSLVEYDKIAQDIIKNKI